MKRALKVTSCFLAVLNLQAGSLQLSPTNKLLVHLAVSCFVASALWVLLQIDVQSQYENKNPNEKGRIMERRERVLAED